MSQFVTPKGTTLPLMDMRGKAYLQVCWRLVWFKEEKPDWSIETDFIVVNNQEAIARAVIKDHTGRIRAIAHKSETQKDFPAGHSEKAETGAIGRALALCGYGTQFAPEFDEEDRIVDSPVARLQPAPAYAKFVEWAKREGFEPTEVRSKVKTMFGKEAAADLTPEELSKLVISLRGDFNESFDESGRPLPGNK